MKQFKSSQLFVVVMISAFVDISSAMDCKEVFQRKEEIAECCTAPSILNVDTFEDCMSKTEGSHHEKFFCGSECALKAQGLMNDDGEIDVDAINKGIDSLEGDWQGTVRGLAETCQQKIKVMGERGGHKGSCSPAAGILIMCMGKGYIKNCPAEHFNDSELCNKVKSGDCDRGHKH